MDDEPLYAQVVQELKLRGPIPGLWAKAYAEANGNEPQAKALYLRYRVEQLAQADRNVLATESTRMSGNVEPDNLYTEIMHNLPKHAPFLLGFLVVIVMAVMVYVRD